MKSIISKLKLMAAALIVGSQIATAAPLAGDASENHTGFELNQGQILLSPERRPAFNHYRVNLPYASDLTNPQVLHAQHVLTQDIGNVQLEHLAELVHMVDRAGYQAVNEHGLRGLLQIHAGQASLLDQLYELAREKDPTLEERFPGLLEANGIRPQADLGPRLARVEQLMGIGDSINLGTFPIPDNSGYMPLTINGVHWECTTEGYLNEIAPELLVSFVPCVSALSGHRDRFLTAVGSFVQGESSVTLVQSAYTFQSIDGFLAYYNVTPTNPDTAAYYNMLRFGGEHVQGKPFSARPTATDTPVVTTNNQQRPRASAPAPRRVVIVNSDSQPVPVRQQ